MDADEGAGHRRIAGQKERFSLFDEAGESIADRIRSQIRSVVANSDHHRRWLLTCEKRTNE